MSWLTRFGGIRISPGRLPAMTAAVVWNGDLPRPLQQVLFDAADGITPPAPARAGEHEPAATGL